ncbi:MULTISPECIES: hypothetical protein [unclassified Streptomyces]|uniref:hypothetical protein n=1 Tax=unclassified Streptomyces TaxID=2593676 RepID=UPI001BE85530|nr:MULTISPECIES: hypothetical protein [unclassified Streptomyces]MBT2405189.1 hypothetical protein [Streptomyces sp. ISL-21]MBT2610957.1 hypothetical protein [Streptomyces sp. ISL-87]
MRPPTPHSALRQLDVLVGEWDMWAAGHTAGPVRTEFAWTEGGAFLVQRVDVGPETVLPAEWGANAPFPTVSVTGYDETAGDFTTLYADGRGVARTYRTDMSDGVWTQWRAAPGFHQRFTGAFGDRGNTITGGWEQSPDGELWSPDFDVTYIRIGKGK